MSILKNQILQLRSQGMTYDQISDQLNCSKGTISYHCGVGQKTKTKKRNQIRRKNEHPFKKRIENFCTLQVPRTKKQPLHNVRKVIQLKIEVFCKMKKQYMTPTFTVEDVLNKIGDDPKCYLTGEPIDINKPRSYAFDHIIPRSRGGSNDLDNLGLCTKKANSAKSDMTPDEFFNLCKKTLQYQGYNVSLKNN